MKTIQNDYDAMVEFTDEAKIKFLLNSAIQLEEDLNCSIAECDTARAESAKLREVLWKTLEAAAKACDENAERLAEDMDFRNKDHSKWWKRVQEMRETIRLTVQLLRESKQDALAATVLKEGE